MIRVKLFCGIVLALLSCSGPENHIAAVEEISLDNEMLSAWKFAPEIFPARYSILIIAYEDKAFAAAWQQFAYKIAERGNIVFLVNEREQHQNPNVFSPVVEYARRQFPSSGIALMGTAELAASAIYAAAEDSAISAVIALSPFGNNKQSEMKALVKRLNGRPLLIIASNEDPVVPKNTIVDIFAAAGELKKLVWLDSNKRGSELLTTHLEPVIRRVTLLHIDKFISKKI